MLRIVALVPLLPALVLPVVLAACGEQRSEGPPARAEEPAVGVPGVPWAKVTRAQAEEAARMGVPAAFENARGMRFVYAPRGTYEMGSPEGEAGRGADESRHAVHLNVGFFVQVGAVTHGHLPGVADASETPLAATRAEAVAFADALSAEDPLWTYRLPTEAEWEYACRAGATTAYPWGDRPDPPAAHRNAWGLVRMATGVREWCADRYAPLPSWAVGDPSGPTQGEAFVVRGRPAERPSARCARREPARGDTRAADLGFRLVVPLGYGLGKYGSVSVTFRLVDPDAAKGAPPPDRGHDLRIIRMDDRLAARTQGRETVWERVKEPGSPVTLTMVPGKYYVYAETTRDGNLARGVEIKFQVWDHPVEIPVPIAVKDLGRFGSGGSEKPQ